LKGKRKGVDYYSPISPLHLEEGRRKKGTLTSIQSRSEGKEKVENFIFLAGGERKKKKSTLFRLAHPPPFRRRERVGRQFSPSPPWVVFTLARQSWKRRRRSFFSTIISARGDRPLYTLVVGGGGEKRGLPSSSPQGEEGD